MDPLHRRDHAELSEARDVCGAQVLRVLDAPAEILEIGTRLERLFVNVEHFAIGAIADRVHAQLHAVLQGETGNLRNTLGRRRRQADAGRRITVRREHPRAARS